VHAARERLQGFEIVEQPPALRHFNARMRPCVEVPARK
jgi:tryptophanase